MDVLDLLPPDPFGMDRSATRFRTFWIGEIENDSEASSFGFGKDEKTEGKKRFDDCVFPGMNFVLKHSVTIYSEPGENTNERNEVGPSLSKYSVDGKIDELGNFICREEEVENVETDCLDDDKGAPPDGLFYALRHLGVKDLLSVQQVCKSLCDVVRNDPLLWMNIYIDQNRKITDDLLFQLTSRAQGNLKCLSVVRCPNITDSGIERVCRSNPGLIKLGVPECVKVSVDGMISKLTALKSAGLLVIKQLRVAGLFNVTQKQFEEMKSLLALENEHMRQISARKPRFYGYGQSHFSFDDDRVIDIETCPMCQEARQVYDCPEESCQMKNTCRGCICCISRCNLCGRCISERAYRETFVKDIHCLDCLIKRGINLIISG